MRRRSSHQAGKGPRVRMVSRADKTFEEMSRQMDDEARVSTNCIRNTPAFLRHAQAARQRATNSFRSQREANHRLAGYSRGHRACDRRARGAEGLGVQAPADIFKEDMERTTPSSRRPYNIGSLDDWTTTRIRPSTSMNEEGDIWMTFERIPGSDRGRRRQRASSLNTYFAGKAIRPCPLRRRGGGQVRQAVRPTSCADIMMRKWMPSWV